MAIAPGRRLTYDDYARFPDDGKRYELIAGEAYMVPSPSSHHQDVVLRLATAVVRQLEEHGGGRVFIAPLDVLLSDIDVVQPDLVFVADRSAAMVEERFVRGTPDWLVEVVSDPVRDRKAKRDLYMSNGVGEYWAADPTLGYVEVFQPGSQPQIFKPPQTISPKALPGLVIDLGELLAR